MPKPARRPKKRARGRAKPESPLLDFCEIQGCNNRATERHHKLRRSAGGKDEWSNLMDICSEHHQWIHANPAESYAAGWLIRRGNG